MLDFYDGATTEATVAKTYEYFIRPSVQVASN